MFIVSHVFLNYCLSLLNEEPVTAMPGETVKHVEESDELNLSSYSFDWHVKMSIMVFPIHKMNANCIFWVAFFFHRIEGNRNE